MSNQKFGGIILNPLCSNRCVFCGNIPIKTSDVEIKQQKIKVYKNLIDLKNQGIKKIEISGGDPLEYDEIVLLIKHIKKMGFEFVQLSTNGVRLSNESFLNKLASSGVDKLRIPLYGSNAEVHDSVTRTKGSFDATFNGIKRLLEKSSNIEIQISCLIVNQNKDNLIELVDLVKGLGITDFYFSIPCVAYNDYSFYIPSKNLGPYAKDVFNYGLKINYNIQFMEIPYCVFGRIDESINNSCGPPNLGKHCQPSEKFRTSIKDLPSYRIKRKVDMCNSCKASSFCDGFFVNDIDKFGVGDLKPIL